MPLSNPFFALGHTLTRDLAETFSAGDFMQQPVCGLSAAECQLITYVVSTQKSALDALHEERNCHTCGNGIEAVFIAVPVVFHHKMRIKYAHAADRANGFILRAVNANLLT